MTIEAPDNQLDSASPPATATTVQSASDVTVGLTPWRDPTAVLTAVGHLVAAPDPAIVLASLAAVCASAIADDCWGTLVQGEETLPLGSAPQAGALTESPTTLRMPWVGADQLTLNFRQPAWEHYPEFSGTLTWRWQDRDRPTRSDRVIAQLLLDRAIELVRAQRLEAAIAVERDKAANLQIALESSREIGQAIGILMSTYKVTSKQGFDLLRTASQHTHRKLRAVATEVSETGMLELPAIRK